MSDLISRQAAIDALSKLMVPYGDGSYPGDDEKMAYDETLVDAIHEIENLPTVQPELTNEEIRFALKQLGAYFAIKMRNGKEGSVPAELSQRVKEIQKYFENVPSAQPEIIRCRNCKFASGDSRICMKFGHSPIGELDFCSWAERRTDEA